MDGKIEKQNDNKPNNAFIKKLKDIQFKLSTSDVFHTIINILIYVLFALIFVVAIYGVITLSSDVQKVFDSLTKLHKVTLDDYINIFKSHDNLILFKRFIMFSEIPLIFAVLSLIFFIKKENKSWIANAIYLCLFMMLNYKISSEFFNNGAFNVESADGVGFAGPFNIAKIFTILQIICIILALIVFPIYCNLNGKVKKNHHDTNSYRLLNLFNTIMLIVFFAAIVTSLWQTVYANYECIFNRNISDEYHLLFSRLLSLCIIPKNIVLFTLGCFIAKSVLNFINKQKPTFISLLVLVFGLVQTFNYAFDIYRLFFIKDNNLMKMVINFGVTFVFYITYMIIFIKCNTKKKSKKEI